jgi:two-component sensor histidine kinase
VKNNLQIIHSLLDLQSARINDELVREMLRDSQNRIRSMALIHQTLYQSKDFAGVDFGTFIDTLIPTLISSYGADSSRIRLSIKADDVQLPLNVAVPAGLLVNELISNALKHAFPGERVGEVAVTLRSNADRGGAANSVVLTVSDNGIGIPEELNLRRTETLGLQLVSLLTDQLHGKLEIQRRDPTQFVIEFRVP